jgi:superfamily II DNA or RNA helicase
MFNSNCVRERSNLSQDNTKYKFDKPSFDKKLLKTQLPIISPKAKTLLDKIKELDENDLKNDNKLYKHFIYCDIKSRRYGANFLASCFLSENYNLGYNSHQSILSDSELLKTKNNNFFLLTSLEVFNKPITVSLKKNILSKFNQRPENIHGQLCRFIIMNSGYKEGVDLFDIKYIHIFEPSLNNADLKQVIGRGTRSCGQKGLKFIPGIGWPLYVYIYDLIIQEEVSSQFLNTTTLNELYLKTLNIDVREIYFTNNLQKLSVRYAVDYDLNKKIHNFRIKDTTSEQQGGGSHCSKLPQNDCNTTSGCYFVDKNRKYCRKGTRKIHKEINICSKKNEIDCKNLKDDCIFVNKYRKYCRRKTKKRENKTTQPPNSSSLYVTPPSPPDEQISSLTNDTSSLYVTPPSFPDEQLSSLTNDTSSSDEENVINMKYRYIPPIHKMSYENLEKFIFKYFKHCKWANINIENACGDDFVIDSDVLTDSNSNKATVGGSTLVNYNPTQMFIGDYFKPTTFVKGMLLWHSVGTGKTCSAIIAASKNFEFKKYTILWVTRTTLKEDIWKNIFDQVCHQKLRKYILKGNKIPEDRIERFRLLSKYWNIKPISYKQFTNLINESNRFYEQLTKRNGTTDPLRKTLLIIDEAHKLYGEDTLSGIERPNMVDLKNAIMKSYSLSRENSVRLLLMTATPITSNPMELIKLLNLCKLPNEQMP